jgi:hypothetical protein
MRWIDPPLAIDSDARILLDGRDALAFTEQEKGVCAAATTVGRHAAAGDDRCHACLGRAARFSGRAAGYDRRDDA